MAVFKPTYEKEEFEAIISRLMEAVGARETADLAASLGLKSPNSIYNARKTLTIPDRWITYIAVTYNTAVDWLLTGEGPAPNKPETVTDGDGPWGQTDVVEAEGHKFHVTSYPYPGPRREVLGETTMPRPPGVVIDQDPDYDWQPQRPVAKPLDPPEIPDWTPPKDLNDDYLFVPQVDAVLSAGGGSFQVDEHITGRLAFQRRWLRRKTSDVSGLVCLAISGDSMAPTLKNNDTVMVDTGRRALLGGHIYAVGLDESILIKRIERLSGDRIKLVSDNSSYQPMNVAIGNVRVIGQVIWIGREIA